MDIWDFLKSILKGLFFDSTASEQISKTDYLILILLALIFSIAVVCLLMPFLNKMFRNEFYALISAIVMGIFVIYSLYRLCHKLMPNVLYVLGVIDGIIVAYCIYKNKNK